MTDYVRYLTGPCDGMRVERIGMETALYSKDGERLEKHVSTTVEDAMVDVSALAEEAYRNADKECNA